MEGGHRITLVMNAREARPLLDSVTVHLQPPLDGALLDFRYRSYSMDELLYSKLSVDGMTVWPKWVGMTDYDLYEVRFPAQNVNGITYLEASTGKFMYQSAQPEYTLILQTLEPEEPEEPEEENMWDAIRAWWNGLSGWKKGIILTTSLGSIIIGGASALKK